MSTSYAAPAGIAIRPPATPDEVDDFFLFANRAFAPEASVKAARGWQRWVEGSPGYHTGQLRAAFCEGRVVGTCAVYERVMRLGPARLLTGCIGAVATAPAYRRRGIAGALLSDAIGFARARGHALLLLDGIPDYYRRFGFVDVFDPIWRAVDREAVLALAPSPYAVRPCTLDDAPALLELYERHYGARPGGFTRRVERWARDLADTPPGWYPPVAVDTAGHVRGYLAFNWEHHGARASEVAADDWPAALALLRCHAEIVGAMPEPSAELLWPLPEGSATHQALLGNLLFRSQMTHRPFAGWQARPAAADVLLTSLAPLWEARWRRSASPHAGVLGIRITGEGGATLALRVARERLGCTAEAPADVLALPPDAFIQLVCGYRPLDWLLACYPSDLSDGAREALRVLFPHEPIWIPGSDSF